MLELYGVCLNCIYMWNAKAFKRARYVVGHVGLKVGTVAHSKYARGTRARPTGLIRSGRIGIALADCIRFELRQYDKYIIDGWRSTRVCDVTFKQCSERIVGKNPHASVCFVYGYGAFCCYFTM